MKKKNKQLSTITPLKATSIAQPKSTTLISPVSTENAFYQSVDEILLVRFIRCLCHQDLAALIISGVVEQKILQETWFNIYMDFVERSEDADILQMIRLQREIYTLKNKILKVIEMVDFLKVQWDEDFVNELRRMNFRYKFDPLRVNEYSRDLKLIKTRLTEWDIRIELYEAEYKAIEEKNSGGEVSEKYFAVRITRLSKWLKFYLDARVITAGEFLAYLNEYTLYCKEVEAENEKQKQLKR